MNSNKYLKLRAERDFGGVFNDTFVFIRQEFKPLMVALISTALPLLLVTNLLFAFYQYEYFSTTSFLKASSNPFDNLNFFNKGIGYLISNLLNMIAYSIIPAVVYAYMKLYKDKGHGNFTNSEVISKTWGLFFPIFLISLVVGIIVALGCAMLCIPGIYLFVPLSLVLAIYVFEGKGFGEAISRSFHLVKQNWWWTLLLIIVSVLIVMMVSGILMLPVSVYSGIKAFHSVSQGGSIETSGIFSMSFFILSGILSAVSRLLYFLFYLVVGLQYFSLIEFNDAASLVEKINSINEPMAENREDSFGELNP